LNFSVYHTVFRPALGTSSGLSYRYRWNMG